MENEVLAAYFSRAVPQNTKDQEEEESKGGRGKKRVKSEEKKKPMELTLEQKSNIATSETDELKEEIERCKNHYESLLDKLKALMEETEVEMSEVPSPSWRPGSVRRHPPSCTCLFVCLFVCLCLRLPVCLWRHCYRQDDFPRARPRVYQVT